jgi:hypothetical protein
MKVFILEVLFSIQSLAEEGTIEDLFNADRVLIVASKQKVV